LQRNATSADDRVVLNIVNQSGNTNILNAITSRTIVIIRFKTLVFVELPINLLFILDEALALAIKLAEVDSNLFVQWDQLVHVLVEDFLVLLACSSVEEATPHVLDIRCCFFEDEWGLDACSGCNFVLELHASTESKCQPITSY